MCVSVIRAFESDEEHEKCYELIDEELFPFLNGDDEVIKELQEKICRLQISRIISGNTGIIRYIITRM